MSLVSIIIPAYNGEKFLKRSIESVLNQTHKDWELIIVDDGSTDNTKQVVSEFQKKDSRIYYFYEENSGGPAKPKNLAIKHAKGEYVAYLDQDDEWLPNKLEKQLNLFKLNTNIGLVGCSVSLARENGEIFREYKTPNTKIFPSLLKRNYIHSNSSVVIRRGVIEKVGERDEKLKYAEDWDMWIRIAEAGYDFSFIEEPLLKYYCYATNVTKKLGFVVRVQESIYIYKKHNILYKKYNIRKITFFMNKLTQFLLKLRYN